MPSPCPGMDPFLEGDLWTSVHTELAVEIACQLSPKLRPRYAALTQKRYVMDTPDDVAIAVESMIPDVGVLEAASQAANGATRTAIAPAPLEIASVIPQPVPHVWIEIRDTENRRLVTTIEFLSPTNKHGEGRDEYLRKRWATLKSDVHLLEIDLVRKGHRVPLEEPLPAYPYFVFLSRANRHPKTEIWPVPFEQPLPLVPVPLLAGDDDVGLDLQAAFTAVYDTFNYAYLINYAAPPPGPLSDHSMEWIKKTLRAAGKMPAQ
jgi:hypothetical protein